ncbi:hypothetical protein TVAG_182320 [Trichomonas vaginalis G3]|uniref:VPS9 domain-containing protein n=1 Tax=Trichomonas vaginalis (strain ATCC PRA-98 / G3) TaxID=412133 RepID=A2D8X0_TRIV3|nr:vacuolar sorting protein 9 (VPS9) domain family [Trichomonas vaginalis G3]EAY22996.1 hypothetical protein TVAG_182320 [Trichomonas vaginalis G3]KAI5518958.1 vacuolar sorting protein 9 (VPS9) domain family [Trichomonas vaginalis G3]|eukprot:XP_001583982.1 hypothetical protein [Trichomonas vaginalis G3]
MADSVVIEKNDIILDRLDAVKDYFSQKQSIPIDTIIAHLKYFLTISSRYYFFNYLPNSIRTILVLFDDIKNEGPNTFKFQNAAVRFNQIYDLIIATKPSTESSDTLRKIISVTPFELESQTMKYHWREQYTFEESIFFSDDHLKPFIDKFLDELDPAKTYYQILDFSKNCASYLQEAYSITEAQPQIQAFSSRALWKTYFKFAGSIFPYHPTDEKFIKQVSYLRSRPPSDLMIREKFLPSGTFDVPLNKQPTLYKHTVDAANYLAFDEIPDDLFYHISVLHDIVFEELVTVMYNRTDKKQPLSQYRADVSLGQEDIMPIIIMILVLADIPNLPDIANFFNDYTTQIEVNSKSGLYMANILTAFGAIMNWEIPQ